MPDNSNSGALEGVRVLELGQLIAGPFCGQVLADMGAEVIKIELPGRGDPMRDWGQGEPVWWPVVARNKKCITLDVRSGQGKAIIGELVEKADIVLENFRPGTMEKWGLGYADLARLNQGIIMVRVSGYGQSGPYSSRAGYGGIGEAMGGLRYIVGDPSTPPSRVGISIGDTLAAMFAAIGALSALQFRQRTGQGQVVDSAIYEAVLGVMESTVPEYDQLGTIRERTGSILAKVAPSNVYPTSDDDMIIMGANQDTVFARLCEAMQQPELAKDERFSTHVARGENQALLDDMISAWSKGFTADDLLALLEQHAVPAGRIYRAPDMLKDEHFIARESIVEVEHPKYENLKMQNVFPRLSATPGSVKWTGPALGEHNGEIYRELLGYSDSDLERLNKDGII
ncbi:MAG: CaiB/BaiF CoA-transferase family protein [Gammaproteobacteria bacterium]|nr:CaiB/BaiF CoA-transferase family protein [Gammaproteobacteria bacterium]